MEKDVKGGDHGLIWGIVHAYLEVLRKTKIGLGIAGL
jgi:hypothetical protein